MHDSRCAYTEVSGMKCCRSLLHVYLRVVISLGRQLLNLGNGRKPRVTQSGSFMHMRVVQRSSAGHLMHEYTVHGISQKLREALKTVVSEGLGSGH